MSKIKFSIIIPTYKREFFLEEAVHSALNQTTDAIFEIIVVNDDPINEAPTHAHKVINKFNDSRIRYYQNQSNLGCYETMNMCVKFAHYEYIVILHDDDLLLPNYLDVSYKTLLKNNNIDMLFCDKKVLVNKKKLEKTGLYKINRSIRKIFNVNGYPVKIKLADFFLHNVVGGPSGVIIRKSKIFDAGNFDASLFPIADYYYWIKYCSQFSTYMLTDELAVCRQENNITLSDGMYPWLFETCHELQIDFLKKNIVKGLLAKSYAYESIKLRIDSLKKNAEIILNLDECYIKATGERYKSNIIRRVCAQLFLYKKAIAWVTRVIYARYSQK